MLFKSSGAAGTAAPSAIAGNGTGPPPPTSTPSRPVCSFSKALATYHAHALSVRRQSSFCDSVESRHGSALASMRGVICMLAPGCTCDTYAHALAPCARWIPGHLRLAWLRCSCSGVPPRARDLGSMLRYAKRQSGATQLRSAVCWLKARMPTDRTLCWPRFSPVSGLASISCSNVAPTRMPGREDVIACREAQKASPVFRRQSGVMETYQGAEASWREPRGGLYGARAGGRHTALVRHSRSAIERARLLIEAGADVKHRNDTGTTALIEAACTRRT